MFTTYEPELTADLQGRWARVRAALKAVGGDALIASTHVNLFYLAGRVYRGYAYLPVEGEPLFFVRRPLGYAGDRVRYIRRPEEMPALLEEAGLPLPRTLLLEDGELPHADWLRLTEVFRQDTKSTASSGSLLLRKLRSVKSPYEIQILEETGARQAAAFAQFPALYRPGMTDQDYNIEMFHVMLKAGALGIFRTYGATMEGFIGSVLTGENGGGMSPFDYALGGAGWCRALPVGQCGAVIREGDTILCDIPGNFTGYMTDCTRTFYLRRVSQAARDAHACSIEIESAIAQAGVPGASCEELYKKGLDMAAAAGFADGYMGARQKAKFVGHGTGLYVNELPVLGARSRDVLEEGMVVAIEPKFVVPGAGAVGVEDTYVVTPHGLRCLTESPRELVEI